jgi:hypothetical protein
MKLALISGAALLATATTAMACPDYTRTGLERAFTGAVLYSGVDFPIVAGGTNSLADCNLPVSGSGYFPSSADFSIDLHEMGAYSLEVTVSGTCDTALLVNTPSVDWFFDDDSAGNLQPTLLLRNIGDGRIDIWVGTYNSEYCDATLHLETWN